MTQPRSASLFYHRRCVVVVACCCLRSCGIRSRCSLTVNLRNLILKAISTC
ncbi:hypothetical protein PF005_g24143 [Phytophthora fragariae]|uniref:Uncharacterized protein n=1 Tax=Phytophthora fragariae TaxID=53985 RepID=A0A6A3ECE7_9STRA|nr:hypothetical protein PF003_g27518 [Phytophthora fragariae]KAE8931292.1 hypothetical protein PF009_g18647 [Phytophthora fragariae]KAE8994640.1 hypothetical protein PF011_g16653 [Phytophthora fragariae]KAE9094685.1 hypothetical protein PF007_g17675 [Phytophthora fragariae]KAE9097230.1 hypothetical protein PF006_g23619 [Phytophthora fragariae]